MIDGGNPSKYRDPQGRDDKISKAGTGNLEANDYLGRASRTVHLLYSVPGFQIGGVATDTLRVDKGTEFVRTNGIASISVPTTSPSGSGPAMKFIYGHVGNRGEGSPTTRSRRSDQVWPSTKAGLEVIASRYRLSTGSSPSAPAIRAQVTAPPARMSAAVKVSPRMKGDFASAA